MKMINLSYTTRIERQNNCKEMIAKYFDGADVRSRDGYNEAYVTAYVYDKSYPENSIKGKVREAWNNYVKASFPWFEESVEESENPWNYNDESDYFAKKQKKVDYAAMMQQKREDYAQWRKDNPELAADQDRRIAMGEESWESGQKSGYWAND